LGPLQHFSVQRINEDGSVDKSGVIAIEAPSALKAGEAALGRRLALHGSSKNAKAVVWRLTAGLEAISTTLYKFDASPPPAASK
jgi:hypothetical protein